MRPWFVKVALTSCLMTLPMTAQALPIGFGYNQGPLTFSEVVSPHFKVYFDARAPSEGPMLLHALDAARPQVEDWFGIARQRPLPVIISAASDHASFANFITDALEVQTLGQGPRSLVWHEYIHQAMYRTVDNFFGPAGNIIHLPWMPAWYIEGLADTLAVSVGSDVLAGIERYQALSGDWPSYARLHSLYTQSGFAMRGYATSAGLVRYMLKKIGPARFRDFLVAFKAATMPWWWPYSVVPFADSLPMDRVLKEFAGMNGEELYRDYQKAAKAYWEKAPGLAPWVLEKSPRLDLSHVAGIQGDGRALTGLMRQDGALYEVAVGFDSQSGWGTNTVRRSAYPVSGVGSAHAISDNLSVFVRYDKANLREGLQDWSILEVVQKGGTKSLQRRGFIYGLTLGKSHLYWLEQDLSVTRLCRIPRSLFTPRGKKIAQDAVECPMTETMPRALHLIGTQHEVPAQTEARPAPSHPDATALWVSVSEEHLTGTLTQIRKVHLESGTYQDLGSPTAMQPLALASSRGALWGLYAARNTRTLRRLDSSGTCFAETTLKDHVLDVQSLGEETLALQVYTPGGSFWRKVPWKDLPQVPCSADVGPLSPIEAALAHGQNITLEKALADADLWSISGQNPGSDPARLAASPTLDNVVDAAQTSGVRPAQWRGRPLFLFPWLGAEDALGPQLGVVSIPLMDDLQNETLRVTLLYGLYSRFPYQDVTLVSTRFVPTLSFGLYRQQTYNGRFIRQETREVFSSFLEEAGGRMEASWEQPSPLGYLAAEAGLKLAYLKPYVGPTLNGRGYLVEPSGSISLSQRLSDRMVLSETLSGRVAPPGTDLPFDYNQLSAGTSLGVSLPLASSLSLGLEGSRTRGKKMRDLREFYMPLKTFIPGSGGGYNRNSFPLVNGAGGLFSPRLGDTQGRARASWTVPVIRNVEKLLWIIYGERLDFTAFYNYGGAWNGRDTGEPPRGWKHLVGAHGYNLDLQMENKGVRFNAGVGTGQVVEKPWEIYLTTGFDAIF